MADTGDWEFPRPLQPRSEELAFDLDSALSSVVSLRSEVPEEAFTASILGTERVGSGVVIREDGLVLTVGYLITEARTIWLTTTRGAAIAGYPLGFDQATGFGLVQALGKLGVPAIQRGSAADVDVGDSAIFAGNGGRRHALKARVIAKREFAGYWEYVLDEAIFTAPAHPQWGGAGLIDGSGKLIGVGSLLVQEKTGDKEVQGNMVVPIDLLAPILDDMATLGRPDRPARPWLGMYTTEIDGRLTVAGVAPKGPAERAGVRQGDIVGAVAGERPASLAALFRSIWRQGPAGAEVPLTILREGATKAVRVKSADRAEFLLKPKLN
ncbi:MAG: serine protease [Alphaproteobacteria bacterium]|nr:serine protease [Alphaproteobacteria bacterium]